jgi:tetratricopeptide (TPR) repeat protein
LEKELRKRSPEYYNLYDKIKNWTTNIIFQDRNIIPEQVEHDVNHINEVMNYANILLKGKIKGDFFDSKDLFLLLSAIYLHDIGMYRGWKEALNIKGNTGELSRDERQRIRNNHAKTSGFFIRSFSKSLPKSLEDALTPLEKKILSEELNEMLAFICESHNQPNIETFLEGTVPTKFPTTRIKIKLIIAVLQFCDTLHMAKDRINNDSFTDALERSLKDLKTETAYEPKDWLRLFQSHFVEEVKLIPTSQRNDIFKILVSVRFNYEETREVQEAFCTIYRKRLEKSPIDCKSVLNKDDIHFYDDDPINTLPSDPMKIKFPRILYSTLSKSSENNQKMPTNPVLPLLLGRTTELEKIRTLIWENPQRLVNITGAPGIGKTAIVQALMDELRLEFNTVFISLQGIDSKEGMVARINTLLGISQTREEDLFSALNGEKQLLILDNLEDPLTNDRTEVIGFIARLIANKGSAQIVATSREALQVAAIETIYKVSPLKRDDSLSLIRQLAEMQGSPEIDNSEDLGILLNNLGDVPLAIVLAAPYLQFGIRELIEDLHSTGIEALRVFGIGKTSDYKDQSIMNSFYRSYRTIEGSDAGRLFQICSLFPAGLSEADATDILPISTHPAFITLLSKSLIGKDQSGRYTMVSPLRLYAEKLFFSDPSAPFDRWICHCLEKSSIYEDITSSGNCTSSVEDLVYELPNLNKVLEFLLSLNEKGFKPGLTIIQNIHYFMWLQGLGKDEIYFIKKFRDRAHHSGDFENEADCIMDLGEIDFRESNNAEARVAFETAIELYKKVGNELGEANCITSLGDIHFRESDNDEARTAFETANALYKKVGSVLGEANCITNLGEIRFRESNNDEARTAYETAIELYKKVGSVLGEADCITNLGNIHLRESNNDEARTAYETAIELYKKVGDIQGEADCIKGFGEIHFEETCHDKAREAYDTAIELYRKVGNVQGEADCIKGLGLIHIRENSPLWRENLSAALRLYDLVHDNYSKEICISTFTALLPGREN